VSLFWAALGALGFTLAYCGAGSWIICRLTDQTSVRLVAQSFLPWVALLPLVSVWGFMLDGIFIGATRTRELMQAMAVSLTLFLAAAWVLVGLFGNHGLWLALLIFMALRGLALWCYLPRITAQMRMSDPPPGGNSAMAYRTASTAARRYEASHRRSAP
jgi:MATE family multidrug resistance protein